ncbi:hypothetical protein ACJROX_27240 [Pseudalkalibacillus sp. A8]|uniref:hypothetical protein n=1 Tax=Pseudalkalibacillus sp. A8 TaxID=3382641 RepID=UPI0038B67629
MPGASNVQTVVESLKAGCEVIKLFPGNFFNEGAIKTLKGPLPQVDFIPTREYLKKILTAGWRKVLLQSVLEVNGTRRLETDMLKLSVMLED